MLELGFDPSFTDAESESGRSLGNRIGQAYIAAFANDGSNEAMDYAGPDAYQSESPDSSSMSQDQELMIPWCGNKLCSQRR